MIHLSLLKRCVKSMHTAPMHAVCWRADVSGHWNSVSMIKMIFMSSVVFFRSYYCGWVCAHCMLWYWQIQYQRWVRGKLSSHMGSKWLWCSQNIIWGLCFRDSWRLLVLLAWYKITNAARKCIGFVSVEDKYSDWNPCWKRIIRPDFCSSKEQTPISQIHVSVTGSWTAFFGLYLS